MLIAREKETDLLKRALYDSRSHFIAVYGRRRIGKTFLIRETFGGRFTFSHSGLSEGSLSKQLFAFEASLKNSGLQPETKAKNWLEAFENLKDLIRSSTEKRKIIFIDELSWMDTRGSDLITALENFWNGWASARNDIVLIICASATSWMMSKVIHNKGGLYNRLTERIQLKGFTLSECEKYAAALDLCLSREQLLQCYMIFGGVPYYWGFLKKGLSLSQNIDSMLFAENAPLRDEYRYLYASLFRNPTVHLKIIETLGTKKVGMTREELISASGIINSGDLTLKLDELESCGFIRRYKSFGMKTKNAVYQLTDSFTLFYLKFMQNAPTDDHYWTNQINNPAINSWMGLAFERVCLAHIAQIKNALGISGVLTEVNSWYCKADSEKGLFGSQIDLLIVRNDKVINLCEMKYSGAEYTVTDKVEREIRRKASDLVAATGTKYAIYPTLVTTYGLLTNSHSSLIQSTVTMDDLFVAN